MPEPTIINARAARRVLGKLMDRAWDGERIVIERNDDPVAILLGMRDYERLVADAPKRRAAR